MRGEKRLPKGLGTKQMIHKTLQRLLPANDQFWPRWLLDGGAMRLVKPKKKARSPSPG